MFAPSCLSSKTNVNFVRKLLPIPHSSLIRHDHNVNAFKKVCQQEIRGNTATPQRLDPIYKVLLPISGYSVLLLKTNK